MSNLSDSRKNENRDELLDEFLKTEGDKERPPVPDDEAILQPLRPEQVFCRERKVVIRRKQDKKQGP